MVAPPASGDSSSRRRSEIAGGESPNLRTPYSPHLESGSRMPSWAGQSYHDGSSDRATSPLGSPGLEEPGVGSLRSPPMSSVRNSRYSAVPVSEDAGHFPQSGRSTPAWLNTDRRSGAFSSAASYANFNEAGMPRDKSRTHSFSSTAMLGRDYDSVAGLNAVAMDKYEGGSWDRSKEPGGGSGDGHPRAAHLSRYGIGAGASKRKKCIIITILAVIVAIVVIAVAVPVAIIYGGDGGSGKAKGTTETDGHGHGKNGELLTTGGNGTVIDLGNGSSFTYINQYGGFWVSDFLNDSARAQSYTKPLSQDWDWANDRMFGVNLGGWLITEPFIAPSLYQPYANTSSPAVDEYTLSNQWLSEGGQANLEKKMRDHYDNFITEQDFAMIAGAGLNWVRLPIGFWAFETISGEPYLAKVSWEYVLKAIKWARKYGLRINLDLHAVPGGQNTYNHSGRLNSFAWLNGVMGIANAQRTLNYIRTMIEFTSQPEIRKVVPLVSILNEPNIPRGIGLDQLKSFYVEAYTMIRNITGTGEGNGPFIGLHDGFMGVNSYNGFLTNADRVAYDTHPYICFTPPFGDSYDAGISNVCSNFAHNTDSALASNGAYMAGEWSLALNDCGLYLNNVNQGTRYEGTYPGSTQRYGSCEGWDNWQSFDDTRKANLKRFAIAQMSSLRNFFFWTWHIGNSIDTGDTVNPMWNYKLGLQQGWMPTNINDIVAGACQNEAKSLTISSSSTSWSGSFQAWQTGKAQGYSISTGSYAWPPATLQTTNGQATASMTDPVSNLPSYTATGPILTVPSPTYSATVAKQALPSVGAWFNPSDTAPMYTAIANCPYPTDPYYNGTLPSGFPCGGNNARRSEPTAAPRLA
ncbi:glycoside hydrolase [Jaminaea rosea]|uniref:glucan 1,3-beta-glucosidase n=1 Tax=Jaminaea rosea TaxID=1569628 RepID=A0A316V3W6_9BASI|nr:glycoside hydrolase [Jaminaea rosea]PWN30893.1 glycoside hydrolase [Jaminaea rosea]